MARHLLFGCLALILLSLAAQPVGAGSHAAPAQTSWETIPLPGATCGQGAPYKYYLSLATQPNQPLVIYFEGGGGCIKEGLPPEGTSGIAENLYCMAYDKFIEPNTGIFLNGYGLFRRDLSDNHFRAANHAFIPYCTGDLHAGTATQPYDYDPDPNSQFLVTHRGHLNTLAALDHLVTRLPGTTPVVLTGSSAGGLGALYNFPAVKARWADTVLVTDAGTLPPVAQSLIERSIRRDDLPWQPQAILPPYCQTMDCFSDTMRLIAAHADYYDGNPGPWRPFGLLQAQRDATQSTYMEVSGCAFQYGLQRTLRRTLPANLRFFLPNTTLHTFLGAPPDFPLGGLSTYRHTIGETTAMAWTGALVEADSVGELPPSLLDAWQVCAGQWLPLIHR